MTYYEFLNEMACFLKETSIITNNLENDLKKIKQKEVINIKIELAEMFYNKFEDIIEKNKLEKEFNFLINILVSDPKKCLEYEDKFLNTFFEIANNLKDKKTMNYKEKIDFKKNFYKELILNKTLDVLSDRELII